MDELRHRRGGLVVLGLALGLTACARFGGTPPAGSPSPDETITHPAGDQLVLRIEYVGGFVPADHLLTRLPFFTLTGDGRVIVPGAQMELYPGPALPPIVVRRLDEAGIQAILHEALASGQLDADHQWLGARMHVADAADTLFTLRAGDREVRVQVYALGIMDGGMTDMSAEEREAHRALQDLVDRLTNVEGWLPAGRWIDPQWEPYRADAFRLIVRLADGEGSDPGGVGHNEMAWPMGGDPAEFGTPAVGDQLRCGVVSGQQALTWYQALTTANELTRWTHGGHRYQVTVRPLLPDDPPDCQAPA